MSKIKNQRVWNKFWSSKSNIIRLTNIFRNYSVKIFVNYIKKFIKNKKVLISEIGCGSGTTSITLSKYGNIIGLDYSPIVLKIAKQNLKKNQNSKNCYFVMGNALNLPFKEKCFDLVFSQGLVEHFENPINLLEEKIRITKKYGYVINLIPSHHLFFRYWYKLVQKKHLRFLYPWRELMMPIKKVKKIYLNLKEYVMSHPSVKIEIVPDTFGLILAIIMKKGKDFNAFKYN